MAARCGKSSKKVFVPQFVDIGGRLRQGLFGFWGDHLRRGWSQQINRRYLTQEQNPLEHRTLIEIDGHEKESGS